MLNKLFLVLLYMLVNCSTETTDHISKLIITDYDYKYKFGEAIESCRDVTIVKYDSLMRTQDSTIYTCDGEVDLDEIMGSRYLFGYHTNGSLVEKVYNRDTLLRIDSTLFGNNKKTVYKFYGEDLHKQYSQTYIYLYDDKQNVIDESKYGEDGTLEHRTAYNRDYKTKQFEILTYQFSALTRKQVVQQDQYGNWEEFTYERYKYDPYSFSSGISDVQESLHMRYDYKYDENGNTIERKTFIIEPSGQSYKGKIIYKHDKQNRLIKQLEFNNLDKLVERQLYDYENDYLKEYRRYKYGSDDKSEILMDRKTYDYS
mgnify:CR=1 FL=1